MPFVQVTLLSKENQNSPTRTCNSQQIALNLCMSDELSPPFSYNFCLSSYFPMYLFISRFRLIVRFNTFS